MNKYIVGLAVVLGFSSFALATHGGDHHNLGACSKDAETFCPGVQHGEGRIVKCLMENSDKVSPECKAQQEKMKEAMKDVKEACHDDVAKFCGDVKAGKGRIMKCMKHHKDDLSQTCKDEIAEKKAEHKKMKK